MNFEGIIADLQAGWPIAALAGAAGMYALMCFVRFVGKAVARFYAARYVRSKL